MAQGKEGAIQTAIMNMLLKHPKVAWAYVTSTGQYKFLKGSGRVTIGFPGIPDIIGQMRTGELLGIEVKQPGEKPSEVQAGFLDYINQCGGIAGYATTVEEAEGILCKTGQ